MLWSKSSLNCKRCFLQYTPVGKCLALCCLQRKAGLHNEPSDSYSFSELDRLNRMNIQIRID
jgi:hypothetical protein